MSIFDQQDTNKATLSAQNPVDVIDAAHDDMRGPGSSTGLGHALVSALPGHYGSGGGRRSRQTSPNERAEEVVGLLSDSMTLVFDGDGSGDDREFVRGDAASTLRAVIVHDDGRTWIARDAQTAAMDSSVWNVSEVETNVAEAVADIVSADQTFKHDLPTSDPDVPGALYLGDDDEVAISSADENEQ